MSINDLIGLIFTVLFLIASSALMSLIEIEKRNNKETYNSMYINGLERGIASEARENTNLAIRPAEESDIMKLLYKNVAESTEYYVISKRQAMRSFTLSQISCVFGFVIYTVGFVGTFFFDKDIALLGVISGTVSEIICGLSFFLYKKAMSQLKEYHKLLSSTERYLTAITLANDMGESKKNEMYEWIIQKSITTDSVIQVGGQEENKIKE